MGSAASPERAVVLEPSERLCELVAILLEETGYQVKETRSLTEALAVLEACQPVSLLFADVSPSDATRLAETVERNWPEVRLIVPCADKDADLPEIALRMQSPWNALDVLIQAERVRQSAPH
jgi:DNA-binding NtrC family response regulator